MRELLTLPLLPLPLLLLTGTVAVVAEAYAEVIASHEDCGREFGVALLAFRLDGRLFGLPLPPECDGGACCSDGDGRLFGVFGLE